MVFTLDSGRVRMTPVTLGAPFADGFEILAQAGVAAVVEPGGSIRDHLTITAAQDAGIPLYFTGVRHFYH